MTVDKKPEGSQFMREELGMVAALAHDGGLIRLSDGEAMDLIRRLTREVWDHSGGEDERRRRAYRALDRALQIK